MRPLSRYDRGCVGGQSVVVCRSEFCPGGAMDLVQLGQLVEAPGRVGGFVKGKGRSDEAEGCRRPALFVLHQGACWGEEAHRWSQWRGDLRRVRASMSANHRWQRWPPARRLWANKLLGDASDANGHTDDGESERIHDAGCHSLAVEEFAMQSDARKHAARFGLWGPNYPKMCQVAAWPFGRASGRLRRSDDRTAWSGPPRADDARHHGDGRGLPRCTEEEEEVSGWKFRRVGVDVHGLRPRWSRR